MSRSHLEDLYKKDPRVIAEACLKEKDPFTAVAAALGSITEIPNKENDMSIKSETPVIRNEIEAATARLTQIRADIEELVARRESLMLTTQAELIAAGIPCFVTRGGRQYDVGDVGLVVESFFGYSTAEYKVDFFTRGLGGHRDVGPHMTSYGLLVDHGFFEVLLQDGEMILVAQVDEPSDTEAPHKRAVSRLRNEARSLGLRVQVRDREVSLISPFNDTVHVGDVTTAFKWLTGNLDNTEVN